MYPFDGEGGVLAHAMFPEAGGLHFDEDEAWAYKETAKLRQGHTDLLYVAIHEIGHTLGVDHIQNKDAIMYFSYQQPLSRFGSYIEPELHAADIAAIQKLYGKPSGSPGRNNFGGDVEIGSNADNTPVAVTTTRMPPRVDDDQEIFIERNAEGRDRYRTRTTPSPRDRHRHHHHHGHHHNHDHSHGSGRLQCPSHVDSMAVDGDFIFIFEGQYVYEIRNKRVHSRKRITELFPAGPRTIEAAVLDRSTKKMLFFTRSHFGGGDVYAYFHSAMFGTYVKAYEHHFMNYQPLAAALPWTEGRTILLTGSNHFAVYDAKNGHSSGFNAIDVDEFPTGVKGAISKSNNEYLLFTRDRVVHYDVDAERVLKTWNLNEYLTC
ncbi:unnamed protein product, partial [Mesorhabditis spiculigera]